MIVGIRNESIENEIRRHKSEAEENLKAWKKELKFAQSKGDDIEYIKYKKYCEIMIKMWENTLKELDELLSL